MDERESRMDTIGMGCFALASIVLFVVVYSPLLWMSGPRAGIRPMTPLPLLAAALAWGGWIPCVVMGVRQLFVKPRYYGMLTIGIGVLQIAAYRLAEWVLFDLARPRVGELMDAFSQRFSEAMRARLPVLAAHLRPAADGESVELSLSAPSGHGELFLSTAGEEVTVGFGPWHGHYQELDYWPDETLQGEPFERVLTMLADFLHDRVVIRIWTRDGRSAGCGPFHWWYSGEACHADCQGDHYSMLSWTGRGDLLPPVPVDPEQRRRWMERMT